MGWDAGGDAGWGGGGGGSPPVRSPPSSPERLSGKRKEATSTPSRGAAQRSERENAHPKVTKGSSASTPRGARRNPYERTVNQVKTTVNQVKTNPYERNHSPSPNTNSSNSNQLRSGGRGSSGGRGGSSNPKQSRGGGSRTTASVGGGKLPPRLFLHSNGEEYVWTCPREDCPRFNSRGNAKFFFNARQCAWKKDGQICTQVPGFDKYYKYIIPNPDPNNFPGGWFCLKCGIPNHKDYFECFKCKMEKGSEDYNGKIE